MRKMKVLKKTKATAFARRRKRLGSRLGGGARWRSRSRRQGRQARLVLDYERRTGSLTCSIFSVMAVEKDMIGMVFVRDNPVCAPWGGTVPVDGYRPDEQSRYPAAGRTRLVLDFATTIVAQGHVRTLLLEGRPIPEGWLIDRQGNSVHGKTLDLDNVVAVLGERRLAAPVRHVQGYGLNLAISIIGGALNGQARGRGERVRA